MELNDNEDKATPRTMLGRRLRRMREDAELSIRVLAEQLGYPYSYIGRVERGEQLPSEALAEALDSYFDSSDLFADLLEMTQAECIADYARTVVDKERTAARIQVFTSSVIPGPLQTEDYARALFRASHPKDSEEKIDALVAARMRRKQIFARKEPPYFWAIMDEAALKRPVGGDKCMREQLDAVLQVSQPPHISVQVLPFTQGEHSMLGGSLVLLTLENGDTLGYVESFRSGDSAESPKKVLELTQLFDVVRSKALPKDESLEMVRAYRKEYGNERQSHT
ncbi:Scr1 family TA system antitoxin-like transcriptional regulator [Streptomyces hygroscopicus]|uniref:helix-turn-helix domain-containing protein n=1 Tax=Streptomyces TaxID=1883 RepID=UPI0020A231EB|nr:helix-turn-helix transcriptional regulator [Streptomyces sp. RKCA744]MCO8305224.1 helix-turn-helix transcriptional regulator [Streptomyces sp. RKCA744]